jgi:hypothetical protein
MNEQNKQTNAKNIKLNATGRDDNVSPKHEACFSKRVRSIGSGKCRSSPANNNADKIGHRCIEVIDSVRNALHNVLLLDHSKVSDDVLHCKKKTLETEIVALMRELDFVISSSSGTIKDKVFNEGIIVLFDAVTIVEDNPPFNNHVELNKSSDSPTMEIWDSITLLLSKVLKDENKQRYDTKRSSFVKLENDEVDVMLRAIEGPMIKMVGMDRNDNALYFLINQEAMYKKLVCMLKCLRIFLTGFCVYLSNEDRIRNVVEILIIPLLAVDLKMLTGKEIETVKVQKMLAIHVEVLQCTTQILRWRQSSSSLLSSQCNLYFDTRRVKESTLSQSIGETILDVLVNIINFDAYLKLEDNSWICYSCDCLITLLKSMNGNTRKKTTVVSLSDQMQIANIFKWVHKSLQCYIFGLPLTTTSTISLLELLKTLVQLYPKLCAQFWALYLPPPSSLRQVKCEHDGTKLPRCFNLIHVMSMSVESTLSLQDIRVISTECCKNILQALPFNLWSRSGYLAGRIESSLSAIIETTVVMLSKQLSVNEMEALYSLAVTIITVVPFDKYSVLMDSAVGLVKKIAQNYSNYGLHGGLGLEVVVSAVIDSLGGKEMPNGDVTPLPLPMQIFLMDQMSSSFLRQLFYKISEISSKTIIERGIQTMIQMQLFVQVVKAAPWIFNDNSKRLESMIDLLKLLLSSEDKMLKITGSELSSAFIVGKNQEYRAVGSNGELPLSLYECLYVALNDKDAKIRCSILSTYSLMSFQIWQVLLRATHNPLKIILSLATEDSGDSNCTVRSEACKALGNITSILIQGYNAPDSYDLSESVVDGIIRETALVTASAADDSNCGVRSMVSMF